MYQPAPFSLRIFVANGDPDGLRLVERSNWIGKAIVFPRSLLPKIKNRDEFNQTGVYLLIGPREDGEGDQLYIGEGDPIGPRLDSHYIKKDFWTRAVFFVAGPGQLNKAHVQYLEARLVQRAKAAKRVPLENGNSPTEPSLSEADRADMDVFLGNLLSMLPVLGIHAFEQLMPLIPPMPIGLTATISKPIGDVIVTCTSKGVVASGYENTQGFVVKTGSQAVISEVPGMSKTHQGYFNLRRDLITRSVMEIQGAHYVFTQDYAFESPSAAAAVILGRAANGRREWKDSSGRTLREIQEASTL